MIDTQIFVFLAQDVFSLSHDIRELLSDYSNTLHMSAESVKELIVAYNNKGLLTKKWKTAEEMVSAIEDEYYIDIPTGAGIVVLNLICFLIAAVVGKITKRNE